jgi:hypothetical protein
MDPDGRYVTMVSHLLAPERLAARLGQLMHKAAAGESPTRLVRD